MGTLLCMPPVKGLFHKAIILSGTILNVNTKEMSRELGLAVLKELGIDKEQVDKIKDVPYKDLYAAGQRAMAASIGTRKPGTPMMWGFGPSPDGVTLLQQPFQPGFADISNDIPIVIGTTFNELQRLAYDKPMTLEQAKEILRPVFEEDTEAYVKAFKKAYPKYTPQDLVHRLALPPQDHHHRRLYLAKQERGHLRLYVHLEVAAQQGVGART